MRTTDNGMTCFFSETFLTSEEKPILVAHFRGSFVPRNEDQIIECSQMLLQSFKDKPFIILDLNQVSMDQAGLDLFEALLKNVRSAFAQIRLCRVSAEVEAFVIKSMWVASGELKKDIPDAIESFGIGSKQVA